MRRFYCEEPITGAEVVLTGPEAHHMLKVDRIRPGELVTVFDGTSVEHVARLTGVDAGLVRLEVVEHIVARRVPNTELTLLSAVPRSRRMDVLVQMSCELGVSAIVPLTTERSVVRPGVNKLQHWRRIVIESCKQCGRNVLMTIEEPVECADALKFKPVEPDDLKLMLSADGDAQPITEALGRDVVERIQLLVGPEGGFTGMEQTRATKAGFLPVSLGPATLRTETAAVCAAALVVTTLG